MSSFELSSPGAFTAGTVGPPGQRVFYLQATEGDLVVTVRCEKQQVSALADYFAGLLDDLEPAPYGLATGSLQLAEPFEEIFTVGPIGVAYDDTDDRIVVVLEEMIDEEAPEGGSVKVRLSRAQVWAFVVHARDLVSAGRPPCRFCGLPLDAEGHACPRMN
jgi:uncharacterized repeat protein (TIGR03847 family)